jgi:hypothetical protein
VTQGVVEAHYLLCPLCGGRASLTDHRCLDCGALAESVEWGPTSPELALVSRSNLRRAEPPPPPPAWNEEGFARSFVETPAAEWARAFPAHS